LIEFGGRKYRSPLPQLGAACQAAIAEAVLDWRGTGIALKFGPMFGPASAEPSRRQGKPLLRGQSLA
jgi:hypothetical protein